jgi:hypothetical protein
MKAPAAAKSRNGIIENFISGNRGMFVAGMAGSN